jgi:hypothetical protein
VIVPIVAIVAIVAVASKRVGIVPITVVAISAVGSRARQLDCVSEAVDVRRLRGFGPLFDWRGGPGEFDILLGRPEYFGLMDFDYLPGLRNR